MDRRRFIAASTLLGTGLAAIGATSCSRDRADGRPNVVFLLTDQMRAEALGCMGNAQVISPHMDRMASEGVLFRNAISSQPACSPFRGQLLTGLYGHTSGVIHNDTRMPDDRVTLGEAFGSAGYATGYIGKWHLSGDRENPVDRHNRRGWDYWAVQNCRHKHFVWEYWENDAKTPTVVKKWEPEGQTDLALDFMEEHADEPFALVVSYGPPHAPYRAPKRYLSLYENVNIERRPNVPPGNETAGNLNAYYAMVTSIDDCVGRVMRKLDELGLADNTILCLTSDHGDMLGSHGQVLKQRPWEEAINVPFIVRYPDRVTAAAPTDSLFSSIDIMPTLLGLCDVERPPDLQGVDHAPALTGAGKGVRDDVFIMNTQAGSGPGCDWRGVRTRDRLYAYNGNGHWLLYDLANDPYQMNNLVDEPEYAEERDRLRGRVEDLRAEVGETIPLRTNRQVRDRIAPLYPVKGAITPEQYRQRWSNA